MRYKLTISNRCCIIFDMEHNFMTPIQMWEGYNPVKDPLETYIQKCNVLNDIAETEMYFTAESLKDGKIRVYSKMYAHKDWDTSHPAVLFLSDLNASSNYVEISEMLVEQGYVVFVVDYAGFMPDVENPTSFPDSLKYASLPMGMRARANEENPRL